MKALVRYWLWQQVGGAWFCSDRGKKITPFQFQALFSLPEIFNKRHINKFRQHSFLCEFTTFKPLNDFTMTIFILDYHCFPFLPMLSFSMDKHAVLKSELLTFTTFCYSPLKETSPLNFKSLVNIAHHHQRPLQDISNSFLPLWDKADQKHINLQQAHTEHTLTLQEGKERQ